MTHQSAYQFVISQNKCTNFSGLEIFGRQTEVHLDSQNHESTWEHLVRWFVLPRHHKSGPSLPKGRHRPEVLHGVAVPSHSTTCQELINWIYSVSSPFSFSHFPKKYLVCNLLKSITCFTDIFVQCYSPNPLFFTFTEQSLLQPSFEMQISFNFPLLTWAAYKQTSKTWMRCGNCACLDVYFEGNKENPWGKSISQLMAVTIWLSTWYLRSRFECRSFISK